MKLRFNYWDKQAINKRVNSKDYYKHYYAAYKDHITDFDYKSMPKKSHQNHIIPQYSFRTLKIYGVGYLQKFVRFIDSKLTIIPFYFLLIIALSGLFMLFFIFLHFYDSITAFESKPFFSFLFIKLYYPINPLSFSIFYGSFFFYLVVLLHSVYKFFYYVFEELRSPHINNKKVEKQSLLGFALFILSEAMLFFAFFWAFFHSSLTPSIFIGNCWPPLGITPLNPWHLPFVNTCILLMSGITVNWFFFTLKRMTYFTFRFSTNLRFSFNYYAPYLVRNTVFNFFFVDHQTLSYNNQLLNPMSFLYVFFSRFYLIKVFKGFFTFFYYFFSNYAIRLANFYIVITLVHYSNFLTPASNFSFMSVFISASRIPIKFLNTIIQKFFYSYSLILKRFRLFEELSHFFFCFLDSYYFDKLYIIRSFEDVYISLLMTIYLGLMFLCLQFCEYEYYATFGIDNIYGTVFYSLTLLHGFHVYVGLFCLTMCFIFFNSFKFRKSDLHRNMFVNSWIIFTVWYWHFVDVVWLFLFVVVYVWGS